MRPTNCFLTILVGFALATTADVTAQDKPTAADVPDAALAIARDLDKALAAKWDKAQQPLAFGVVMNSKDEVCRLTSSLGRAIERELINKGYRVVERAQKKALDNELAEQGRVFYDPEKTAALGKRLGASGVILASVADKEGQDVVTFDVWVTEVTKGEKVAAAQVKVANTPGVREECQALAKAVPVAVVPKPPEPPIKVESVPVEAKKSALGPTGPGEKAVAGIPRLPVAVGAAAALLLALVLIVRRTAAGRQTPVVVNVNASATAAPTPTSSMLQAARPPSGVTVADVPGTALEPVPLRDLVSIQNPRPSFRGRLWTSRADDAGAGAGREGGMPRPAATYHVGQDIQLRFQCERDCWLWVFDVGTSGTVRLIFPNKWHRANRIEAGKLYTLPGPEYPFKWTVEPPEGVESVKAFFLSEPVDLLSLNLDEGFPDVTRGGTRDIGVVYKDIHTKATGLPPEKWAESRCEFVVKRR